MFLYMAVLAPAIAFGGVMATVTSGALGPREVLVSCGVSGMLYSILSGQPMTFLAPTGLTLSFIGALAAWTTRAGVPFLAMYAWCGLWTCAMLLVMASFNASGLIKYCTRFTEDVFNSLLGLNFIMEGGSPVARLLGTALKGTSSAADALLAANAALMTAASCRIFAGATRTRYLTAATRTLIADFGPALVIIGMSALLGSTSARRLGDLTRLNLESKQGSVPTASLRGMFKLVDLGALSAPYRLLAAIPAIFLSMLFFLDQNITVRTVNSPQHNLQKGEAYHLDLAALGIITGVTSMLGLPWMCSATVQSLNHVRALSTYGETTATATAPPNKPPQPPAPQLTAAAVIASRETNSAAAAAAAGGTQSPGAQQGPGMMMVPFDAAGGPNKQAATLLPRSVVRPAGALPPLESANAIIEAAASSAAALSASSGDDNSGASPGAPALARAGPAPQAAAAKVVPPPPSGGGATAVAKIKNEQAALSADDLSRVATTTLNKQSSSSSSTEVTSVVETRLTGFAVHAAVLASLYAAPTLSEVPLAVIWGVFLFLGSKVIAGNQFILRVKALFVDSNRLDPSRTVERTLAELGRAPVVRFTAVQAACLAALWTLKLNPATAMVFPSVIGVLLVIRAKVLPKMFAARELLSLDTQFDI